ncbi:MAG: hypothetical protein PHQ98_01155 [Candidatus ainarchaeum sp.]|nr:hypothetical protein [Candidatus ainarchaeum sp.]
MLLDKLKHLGTAASYDSCGAGKRLRFRAAGIKYENSSFIHNCNTLSENQFPGHKCLLMKVLQDNTCMHDCKYCANTTCKNKTSLEPTELASAFMHFYYNREVTGLFLSSAVHGEANQSMEKMIESVKLIRQKGFLGYIHAKVLPEASNDLINEMSKYANRLSINIESANKSNFSELTTTKNYKGDLLKKIKVIDKIKKKTEKAKIKLDNENDLKFKSMNFDKNKLSSFTTQIIVGATDETDKDVINRMTKLYDETDLHRTYFSAFKPVSGTKLENRLAENEMREHRLFETDFLLRLYGFSKKDIFGALGENNNLAINQDVKMSMALKNKELFPIDPNTASEKELLLIPGFGPKRVETIIKERENKQINNFLDLEKIGIKIRKANNFIKLEGKQTNLLSF